jgi:hypothetical protein
MIFFFFFFGDKVCVAQVGLQLAVLLPQPSKCRDDRSFVFHSLMTLEHCAKYSFLLLLITTREISKQYYFIGEERQQWMGLVPLLYPNLIQPLPLFSHLHTLLCESCLLCIHLNTGHSYHSLSYPLTFPYWWRRRGCGILHRRAVNLKAELVSF